MMKYVISVIIPVYNAERTIRRCVESLALGQQRNIQIILADDCSKDHSWDVCQELADEFPNVLCVKNDMNRGVSYTRNRALCLAEGSHVLFVDSDDWVSRNYASALWYHAKQAGVDTLILCAYHYVDHSTNTRSVVHGGGALDQPLEMSISDAFTLAEKTLLQQLWNKIFRRDVIEAHHIRFDESMSMGEDFQFVLDYMTAIQCKKCVVLHEPLYYYIRWNNSSLMSKFGPATRTAAIGRFERLRDLAGSDSDHVQVQFRKAVNDLHQTYIYRTIRDKRLTKEQKISIIRDLTDDASYRSIYRAQTISAMKERGVALLSAAAAVPRRILGRYQRFRQRKLLQKTAAQVTARDLTILSQNCIGGVFCHDVGMQFLSPTVNLFFKGADFVKFALDPEHYLGYELQMSWGETYPIGMLDDIRIYFMHYETCQEAKQAWERRVKRIRYDRIVVVATDRNGFQEDVFQLWKKIPYPKVLFTANPRYAQDPDSVFFPEYQAQGFVPDLIPRREFYKDGKLIHTINQLGGTHDPTGKT